MFSSVTVFLKIIDKISKNIFDNFLLKKLMITYGFMLLIKNYNNNDNIRKYGGSRDDGSGK